MGGGPVSFRAHACSPDPRDTARAMPEENLKVARQPITVRAHTRRRLEERLALRLPRASALVSRAAFRLPPRTGLRRTLIRRFLQVGIEAYNRRDLEAFFTLIHPEAEFETPSQLQGLGLDAIYRGRKACVRFEERWIAEWGEFEVKPAEFIDLGGRVLILGRLKGSGQSSGAAIDNEWADLDTVSAGRVIRRQIFLDQAEALAAAGLSE
jgi:ketosteroid isomerase-like protein